MTEQQKWEWIMSRNTEIQTTPEPENKITGIIAVCLIAVCIVMCLVHAFVVGM